ncbi:MAG: F-type H+-transporting ATPase subunit b [Planctomycetota bacterium]|jgi:F-type H+-transporting ATPase subunit b
MTLPILVAEGGFNPLDLGGGGGFFFTLVIFIAALYPMWKVVWGPITVALSERDAKATEAIAAAEKASQEAEKSRAAVEVALGEAQAEAAKVMAAARERAETRENDIIDTAKKEADAMIENARATIQAEQEKALTAIRNEVVELSLNAASQVLGRRVDSDDDRRMVADLVATSPAGSGGEGSA